MAHLKKIPRKFITMVITIIMIAIFALLGSCKSEEKRTATILSGILPDLKNESITLIPVQDYFPALSLTESYPTVKTDSLGNYKFRFIESNFNSNFYQIVHNNYHQLKADIYLKLGDSLFINQSAWNDSPILKINGKGSEKLEHLEKDFSIFPKDKIFLDKIKSDFFSSELDFKKFIDSKYFERVNALDLFKEMPESLRLHHLNTLKAERAKFLLEHLEKRNYYMKQEFSYFYPEASYFNFLDSITFDKNFSQTTASKLLSNTYLNYIARKAFKSKTDKEWWQKNLSYKLEYVTEQSSSSWTDLLALSTISKYSFGLMNGDFFDDLGKFERTINFSNTKSQMLYNTNAVSFTNLAPGKPAPGFELPDSNGVTHRLSDYKGSVVYIDFWGTWCYPCIKEIPDALKLQEKYKDQPVTFLYVALEYDNKDIAGWKEFISGNNPRFGKFLNNKAFPGVHLVAEKQFKNESISAYKINFAPTHVLIDQRGTIVKARAKGAKDIHEDIDELLKVAKKD